jgi:hypothetical protein
LQTFKTYSLRIEQRQCIALTKNDLSLIRHNVHRTRSFVHPLLPKYIKELRATLESINIKTNIGEPFLFINDKENFIIVIDKQKIL